MQSSRLVSRETPTEPLLLGVRHHETSRLDSFLPLHNFKGKILHQDTAVDNRNKQTRLQRLP